LQMTTNPIIRNAHKTTQNSTHPINQSVNVKLLKKNITKHSSLQTELSGDSSQFLCYSKSLIAIKTQESFLVLCYDYYSTFLF